jgi:predicted nucleotidyltransferase
MRLDEDNRAELDHILARTLPAGVKVFAFGSRVHGRNLKPFSDIDLCLRGDKPVTAEVMMKIRNELEDSMLPFKVDVVDWATLSPEFRAAIAGDLEELTQS